VVNACTIIARNYLAHARVLVDSFFAHHPDGAFTLLLIDDEGRQFDAGHESFRCLRLGDIGFDRSEIGQLASIYDVTELATAVKPPFLRYLIAEGCDHVIYLDPDIRIYKSLEDAARLARQHAIVLTPHTTVPVPPDGRRVDAFHILGAGVYNLGFIAVGAGARAFIDWWWEKTRREARSDPLRMMFTDQRWVDFVPSFFDHFILKDPTYNVAYWNLHARRLTWDGHTYLVDGQPLAFFHFSGFDERKPYLLSKHQGRRPRILLSEHPAVARICRDYLESLERAGLSQESSRPYGWGTLPCGIPFDRRMRRLYRAGLEAHEKGRGPEPPNPLDGTADDRFIEWLNEPAAVGLRPRLSRYLDSLYRDRADLRKAFPDLAGEDGSRYLHWIHTDGMTQEQIAPQLIPVDRQGSRGSGSPYAAPSALTEGVNIAGYFRAEAGVGEAARLLTTAVEAAGIPYSTLAYDATASRKAHPFSETGDRGAPHDINIVCVNADQTPTFAAEAGPRFFEGRHTAGYWFWELELFPSTMHSAFDHVDEVWTATQFAAGGIRAIGRRPVYTIPVPVSIPRCSPDVTRESLRLPSGFMFLFVFDFFSVLERKNPIGLIDAFSRAFRPAEGPILVIKTINGDSTLNGLEKIRAAAAGRPDIVVIDEYYSAEEKNALLAHCDCYVSLHRSEGFGLTMAEAMGLEKPVIATAYSGNLDFMTPDNSYLVDYVTSSVPEECDPYPRGARWADPNLEQATEFMRRVYTARAEATKKAQQARHDILTKHNARTAAAVLTQRLDDIRRSRHHVPVGSIPPGSTTTGVPRAMPASDHENAIVASLDDLATRLTPTPSVEPRKRLAQEALFRLLRPFWWHQRQIQESLIAAVREAVQAAGRAARSEPHQRQALESLWTHVHSLQGLRHDLQEHLESLEATPPGGAERTNLLETTLSDLQASVASLQENVARQLAAFEDRLVDITASNAALPRRLYSAPYMDDPDRFHYTDEHGKRVLGFQSRRAVEGDVSLGFEAIFRGSEAFVRDRFRSYLPLLRAHQRVIDVGCGRGEMLDLLREAGVPAAGVDIDEVMVRHCREKGHTVELTDPLGYLRQQPDCSLPAIFSARVVEHLTHEELFPFLEWSRAKLTPGGLLVFETVNPHALETIKPSAIDPTLQRLMSPEVAVAWCWLLGFEQTYVFFPNGSGDLEQDRTTQGEYAVVAGKGRSA
jgi:2-polyprenyl-3-methyl-5-hydroxy-6-metoxy-1,4-benzoquinol methylase